MSASWRTSTISGTKSAPPALRERVGQRFLEHVRIASLPHAQLTAEQKEFKMLYNRGRRELEHEFGKTMRYSSIRDLVAGDPGSVLQDLKPVWLMSPLSVSDTLPLDARRSTWSSSTRPARSRWKKRFRRSFAPGR